MILALTKNSLVSHAAAMLLTGFPSNRLLSAACPTGTPTLLQPRTSSHSVASKAQNEAHMPTSWQSDSWQGVPRAARGHRTAAHGSKFQQLESEDSQSMLPHRRRAAARKAGAAAGQAETTNDPKPRSSTFPSTTTEGPWQPALSRQSPSASATLHAPTPATPPVAGGLPYDTFVPRNPGVTDGPWNQMDKTMLQAAVSDAEQAVTTSKIDAAGYILLGKSLDEVESLVAQHGQPRYRAKQLMDGVLKGARSLDSISNVPKELRAVLTAAGVRTGRSVLHKSVGAADGTRKFLLQLHDGRVVETVGIPNDEDPAARTRDASGSAGRSASGSGSVRRRLTVCVSSQVGCPMRCSFCATGKGGFYRNLMPHEIMDQVMTVQEEFGVRVSNVVFMGMGEPLLNVPSVVKAYDLINQQLGIGGRSITISTVGVPNAIARLAKARLTSTLAVSIHAPTQELRESIIPSAKAYPLQALMKDCTTYYNITGRRVTFEYTLLSGVNDAPEHAKQLGALLRSHNLMSHVNLIPWNPVDESEFVRPPQRNVTAFVRELEAAGLTATVRITRGLEAAAACGQLRNMFQKEPLPAFALPT